MSAIELVGIAASLSLLALMTGLLLWAAWRILGRLFARKPAP